LLINTEYENGKELQASLQMLTLLSRKPEEHAARFPPARGCVRIYTSKLANAHFTFAQIKRVL
jgi:hypothetical protein